MRDAVALMAF